MNRNRDLVLTDPLEKGETVGGYGAKWMTSSEGDKRTSDVSVLERGQTGGGKMR